MANTYLKAAVITLALTLLGLFFISQLDAMRAAELQKELDSLVTNAESERLLFLYSQVMGNSSEELCSHASSAAQTKASQAYNLMQKINFYEKSNVANGDYERIKEKYYLSNAGLYLNLLAAKKYCEQTPYTTVLFFYKVKEDCSECRAQGGVLDNLRKSHPELRVFAFPMDSCHEFVNVFVRKHGITQAPSLVIEESVVLSGLKSEPEIEPYLNNVQNGSA